MKPHIPYAEKLKDPRWQKKRLKVLEHAEWRCQLCGAQHKPLHVHHSYYTKRKDPWQYPLGSLIAVCEACHEIIHRTVRQPTGPNAPGKWTLVFKSNRTKEPIVNQHPITPGEKFAALKAMLERQP